ncbi:MAG: rhomboid family intramembrane serine protease [Bacteroidales bacterium]|nr:rhomboid family intramembrane serine protease [Bacteroidales bacterium]
MIPLRDTIPAKTFPLVNWLIIVVNLAVFLAELRMSESQLEDFFYQFGLVPSKVMTALFADPSSVRLGVLSTFATNIFIHGNFLHFIGNMWFLFIFGDNVEDKMGKLNYLLFYLLAGLLAGMTHFALYIHSTVPAIGASGAISGIMAAYMFLFPRSRIITLIPVFYILPLFISIRAFIFIGIWFLIQLINGASHLLFHGAATGIAFWAHIGGFVAGGLLFRLFVRKKGR